MKRSNAQYTWFLIYLTEQSLFTLYRMWRHQIIATYPCKHQSLREAAISVLGMIRRILGSRSSFRRLPWSPLKNLIVVTLTTICISLSACCCIHFVEVRFFGAWLAGVPCQKAIVILSILDIAKCQWMDPRLLIGSFEFQDQLSPPFLWFSVVCCARIVRINDQIHQMKHLWWSQFPCCVLNTLL